jgi:hypothetical protein
MAEQLGRVDKPEAGDFAGKRKLFLVPLLFAGEKAPVEYVAKFELYWQQVGEHVANLESRVGPASRVYHESIYLAGEEGLEAMEKLSPSSAHVAGEKLLGGAVLEATEDRELAGESMDWERFLLIGFLSQKVAEKASEFYLEALRRRYEHIARCIDQTLQAAEAGILFIREGHMVQFAPDIEVFSVAPPALDEIHRWQRDRLAAERADACDQEPEPPGQQ